MRQARSDKLMQFHDLLDPPATQKQVLRQQINREVEEYLARGGQLHQCAHGDTGYRGSVRGSGNREVEKRPRFNRGPD